MASPEEGLRHAFGAMVGAPATDLEGRERSIEALLEEYGGTAGLAAAAGFGTAAEARAAGAAAVRARETFMRDVRRYRQGTRRPSADMRALFGLDESPPRPDNARQVAELAALHGLTFSGTAFVRISNDEVWRVWSAPGWFISPAVFAGAGGDALLEAIAGRHWDDALPLLETAMGAAYGVYFVIIEFDDLETAEGETVPDFSLSIGRARGAQAMTT